MENDPSYLLSDAIGAGILWIVYSVLVLFMVKVQKMKVSFLGVLISCLFGILATCIPYAGMYVSFPVTVFCLWRFAGTHAFGDAIFTVVISGALMFCFKLFLLASLIGNLSSTFDDVLPELEMEVSAAEPQPAEPPTVEVASQEFDWASVDKDAFALKGITAGAKRQLVMFQYEEQMYTLELGESCGVRTDSGVIRVKCEKVTRSAVEFLLNDQETFKLSLD